MADKVKIFNGSSIFCIAVGENQFDKGGGGGYQSLEILIEAIFQFIQ